MLPVTHNLKTHEKQKLTTIIVSFEQFKGITMTFEWHFVPRIIDKPQKPNKLNLNKIKLFWRSLGSVNTCLVARALLRTNDCI